MALTSILLEFSEDPLSDASPTWTDVTSDLKTIEWWAGIDREGDEPKPGGATIRLKNTNRRWEPDFEAGQFFPNVTTGRRFRLSLNDGGGSTQEGLWYVSDIAIDYPAGTGYSEVTMSCSDGCEVLALDSLPLMDPPDANTYEDVVNFDQPFAYYRIGERDANKLVAGVRRVKRGKGKRRKFRRERFIREREVELLSVSGPAGQYRSVVGSGTRIGRASLILGDTDTCVDWNSVAHARAPLGDERPFSNADAFTLEAWVTGWSAGVVAGGPLRTADSLAIFSMDTNGINVLLSGGNRSVGNAVGSAATIHHWVGTWDGQTIRFYEDGVLNEELSCPGETLRQEDLNAFIYIHTDGDGQTGFDGVTDEVAFYTYALSAERILAHYEAGSARGWDQQTAGERIADIATHALWSEASIQTAGRDVMPQFKHGQAKLEEIGELAHAEGPRTMFFFNGTGDPVYLGHEWQATSASYNTVQATLGDNGGEVGYQDLELVYDNETYNEVTASHESGEAATASDTTAQTERGRRANTEYTDVLLMEHNHVESLANAVLAFYKDPALRPVSVTVNGADTTRLGHILDRDIGHLVRVKKSGETGARIDRVASIIGKRKVLTADKLLTCQWTLSRGFNASTGIAHAGIVGFSEAGTAEAA